MQAFRPRHPWRPRVPPIAPAHPNDIGSPNRTVHSATLQKPNLNVKAHDKELKVSAWTQNSPDPNLTEHPWDEPETAGSMKVPPCKINVVHLSTCQLSVVTMSWLIGLYTFTCTFDTWVNSQKILWKIFMQKYSCGWLYFNASCNQLIMGFM